MPTYDYECHNCKHEFEVIKSISRIDDIESCSSCGKTDTRRIIFRFHFYGASDWDKGEYNPAFGKFIRNARHRKEEAKRRGMIEVGNEDVEKIHKRDDDNLKQIIENSWSKV